MSEIELQRQINGLEKRLSRTETWDSGGGSAWRYATFVIAASDSTALGQANADYVCDGTNDQDEINTAIALATTSGFRRILLLEGTFSITQQITMASNMMLEGQGDATVLVVDGRPSTNILLYVNALSNVTVRNLKVDGNSTFLNFPFRINDSSNVEFSNIWFYDISATRVVSAIGDCSDLVFARNRFSSLNSTVDCIVIWAAFGEGMQRIIITENQFENSAHNSANAIEIEGDVDGGGDVPALGLMYIRDVIISDNFFIGDDTSHGYFIGCSLIENVTVIGNVGTHLSSGVVCTDCFLVTITGNFFSAILNAGIWMNNSYPAENNGGSRYFTISANVIRDSTNYGILIWGPADFPEDPRDDDYKVFGSIVGNVMQYCTQGIFCTVSAILTVDGNVIQLSTGAGIHIEDCFEIVVCDNSISQSLYGILLQDVFDISCSDNIVQESSVCGFYVSGATDVVISDNYLLENGTGSLVGDSDILIHSFFGNVSTRVSIHDNVFHVGYITLYGSYCVHITDASSSAVIVRDNDFRNGYSTRISNAGGMLREYGNLLPTGVQTQRFTRPEYALTVSGGVITMTDISDLVVVITPETGTTDDVDTITATIDNDRQTILCRVNDNANTITMKDGTGNMALAGDFAMDNVVDRLQLMYDYATTTWVEISRSNNG